MIGDLINRIKSGLTEITDIKNVRTFSDESELSRLIVEPSAAIIIGEIYSEKKGSQYNKNIPINIYIKTRKPNDNEANQTADYIIIEAVFSAIEAFGVEGYTCGHFDAGDTFIIRRISFKWLTR